MQCKKNKSACSAKAASTPRPFTPEAPSSQINTQWKQKPRAHYAKTDSKRISYIRPLALLPPLTAFLPILRLVKCLSRKLVTRRWATSPYCPYRGGDWRALHLSLVLVFPVYLYTLRGLGKKEEELVRERYQVSKSVCAGLGESAALPRPLLWCAQERRALPPRLQWMHPSRG